MPNHCLNRVVLKFTTKKSAQEFIDEMRTEEEDQTNHFDFNKIIPQPANLYRDGLSSDKEQELKALGIPDWYSWNTANWGTKWNSYYHEEPSMYRVKDSKYWFVEFQFTTAWGHPFPIVRELSEQQLIEEWEYDIECDNGAGRYFRRVDRNNNVINRKGHKYIDYESGEYTNYYSEGGVDWRVEYIGGKFMCCVSNKEIEVDDIKTVVKTPSGKLIELYYFNC